MSSHEISNGEVDEHISVNSKETKRTGIKKWFGKGNETYASVGHLIKLLTEELDLKIKVVEGVEPVKSQELLGINFVGSN
jgi:hypothetical protein